MTSMLQLTLDLQDTSSRQELNTALDTLKRMGVKVVTVKLGASEQARPTPTPAPVRKHKRRISKKVNHGGRYRNMKWAKSLMMATERTKQKNKMPLKTVANIIGVTAERLSLFRNGHFAPTKREEELINKWMMRNYKQSISVPRTKQGKQKV